MGNESTNLEEKLNRIFVDKYADYLDLMRVAGCTEEELISTSKCVKEYKTLTKEKKAQIIKDDMSFLDFFTSGGIVMVDDSGRRLYSGINKEIAHSVMCTMSSIKPNVEFPEEYKKELDESTKLPTVKDMISYDMTNIFPDMKKLFFLGKKEEFHSRMSKVFRESSELERFSDIIDDSVLNNSEAGLIQYMNMAEDAKSISKEIDFIKKGHNL